MAIYSINYQRPGEPSAIHELEAKSEPEARMRFLNLSWVAFTAISVVSIGLKGNQPEEAKAAARAATRKTSHAVDSLAYAMKTAGTTRSPTAPPGFDPAAEINRLTDEIGDLADQAQALTRAGDHDAADALRAKAKQLAATRAEITKRNRRR